MVALNTVINHSKVPLIDLHVLEREEKRLGQHLTLPHDVKPSTSFLR